MSGAGVADVLRPAAVGLKGWIMRLALPMAPIALGLLRRLGIIRLGSLYVVTRHDDVREVFGTDTSFGVPYEANLQVITGGEPFFLGMGNSPAYRAQLAAMHRVFLPGDLALLGDRAEALAEVIVSESGGQIDIVDLVRKVTFGILAPYIGIPEPKNGRLDLWATRLFEFQFVGSPSDLALMDEVNRIAPAFRQHIDSEIERRKSAAPSQDDVLGRCLALQRAQEPGYSDVEIRTALLCMIVGGPPQAPMVVPQAMEQLLRRPSALADAQAAAKVGNDGVLAALVREAMRFDPLAPGLPRRALKSHVVAFGTSRATTIPQGATVIVAFSSAMLDPIRVPNPQLFDAGRLRHEYIHFGYGLHACFGLRINEATLHRMVKPVLRRPGLRRADGAQGRLCKRGIFADRLAVQHD